MWEESQGTVAREKWDSKGKPADKKKCIHYQTSYCSEQLELNTPGELWKPAQNTRSEPSLQGQGAGVFVHPFSSVIGWELVGVGSIFPTFLTCSLWRRDGADVRPQIIAQAKKHRYLLAVRSQATKMLRPEDTDSTCYNGLNLQMC